MDRLLGLAGTVVFFGAMPMLLRIWLRRQAWTRVEATVTALDADGRLVCAVPSPFGPVVARVTPHGEATAAVGDRLVLYHPPGQPAAADHGSAPGYLAVAGICGLLGLASLAMLLGMT